MNLALLLKMMYNRLCWEPMGRSGALCEAPLGPYQSRLSDKDRKARKKRNQQARASRRVNRR
jgi:hypothetical protein